jgi:2-polyprenyl-3-methyl-5-hydroxy-6-metoxy-1,4-benzoquinol methylase
MSKSKEQTLWERTGSLLHGGALSWGPHFSYQYKHTPRHILFTLARYKFAQKMIGDGKDILDLGCNEGVGCRFLGEFSKSVLGVDFDKEAIRWAKNHQAEINSKFICDDFLGKRYGAYDAVVSYDVIEHIYPENETLFWQTVTKNLKHTGICVIGTPNVAADKFSSPKTREAHVNAFDGESLYTSSSLYFHNVFLFSMNDEIVHTGFSKLAHYLIALCAHPDVDKRNIDHSKRETK